MHHADEAAARRLVKLASPKTADTGTDEEGGVLTDTGWFQLDLTRVPARDDLQILHKNVGDMGVLAPPKEWKPLRDRTIAEQHEILPGSPEYDSIVQELRASCRGRKILVLSVKRIQNLAMWQSYVVKRQTIIHREKNIDSKRLERRWLWHGSDKEGIKKITQQGFNRSFCGRNATAYGKGVYFARDSFYSADPTYAIPDHQGDQYMLACRVVVGEYCKGQQDALTPAIRDSRTHALYDTTVDNPLNPSVYVTYHDAQAYPEVGVAKDFFYRYFSRSTKLIYFFS